MSDGGDEEQLRFDDVDMVDPPESVSLSHFSLSLLRLSVMSSFTYDSIVGSLSVVVSGASVSVSFSSVSDGLYTSLPGMGGSAWLTGASLLPVGPPPLDPCRQLAQSSSPGLVSP